MGLIIKTAKGSLQIDKRKEGGSMISKGEFLERMNLGRVAHLALKSHTEIFSFKSLVRKKNFRRRPLSAVYNLPSQGL